MVRLFQFRNILRYLEVDDLVLFSFLDVLPNPKARIYKDIKTITRMLSSSPTPDKVGGFFHTEGRQDAA